MQQLSGDFSVSLFKQKEEREFYNSEFENFMNQRVGKNSNWNNVEKHINDNKNTYKRRIKYLKNFLQKKIRYLRNWLFFWFYALSIN